MTKAYPYECKTLEEQYSNKQEYIELEKLEEDFFAKNYQQIAIESPFFYTRISYEMNPFDETYDSLRIYQTRPVCFLADLKQKQNQYEEF